jgi:hypothetical protein
MRLRGKDGPCGDSPPGCPAAQVYRAASLCFRIVILAEHMENGTHQRSRRACPERCEEIPTSSTTLVFLKARAPEGPMESPPSPMRPGAPSFVSFTKAAHSLLSPQRLQIDDRPNLHHPRRPLIDLPHPHFPIRATPIAEVVETPLPPRRSWSGSPEPSPLSPCHPEHCVKSLTTQTSLA